MAIVYNSGKTADTINRAIDNSMGTTTTTQGAAHDGEIVTEDLQPVVQCTGGYTNPVTVKTISGVPPVEFHAVEGNLKSWSIYGNTVEGTSVGEKTDNIFDVSTWDNVTATRGTIDIISNGIKLTATGNDAFTQTYSNEDFSYPVSAGATYTLSWDIDDPNIYGTVYIFSGVTVGNLVLTNVTASTKKVTFTIPAGHSYLSFRLGVATSGDSLTYTNIMLNTGDTAKPYEPYGYKVPIECAGITYNCYISDVLRKSTPVERKRKSKKAVNDTTVYDVMDSTGTVYRNVDTDGTPLETPTTETYTAPTITTIWGYNEFDVDTTVTPSNVTVQYYDN